MPKPKFWDFKNKDKDTGELMLYGDISSSSWYGDEVTPKDFKKDLDALGDIKDLNIYINSGGGDVFAGQAIYSMLNRHLASKTVYVDGLAASIASVIAMAGDKIIMPKNAMMMIHNAWTIAAGSKEDFRKLADDMEKIDESIVSVYADKTGLEIDEIKELMNAETWMTAEDAKGKGFVDEIEQEKKVAASIEGGFFMLNGQRFELSRYKNPPAIEPNTELIETTTLDGDPQYIQGLMNDSRDESRPVADKERLYQLRQKLNGI